MWKEIGESGGKGHEDEAEVHYQLVTADTLTSVRGEHDRKQQSHSRDLMGWKHLGVEAKGSTQYSFKELARLTNTN